MRLLLLLVLVLLGCQGTPAKRVTVSGVWESRRELVYDAMAKELRVVEDLLRVSFVEDRKAFVELPTSGPLAVTTSSFFWKTLMHDLREREFVVYQGQRCDDGEDCASYVMVTLPS